MTADLRVRNAAVKMIDKAIRAASRKLPFRSESSTEKMLDMAVGEDTVAAYRIGAEEAQSEIEQRLYEIRRALFKDIQPKVTP